MESLSTKDFLEKLNTNNLKPGLAVVGIVKKAENKAEVMFASKNDFSHWMEIPVSMIGSVNVLKNISWEGNNFTLVKLHLNKPTDAEAKILFELLDEFISEKNKEGKCFGMNDLWHCHKDEYSQYPHLRDCGIHLAGHHCRYQHEHGNCGLHHHETSHLS